MTAAIVPRQITRERDRADARSASRSEQRPPRPDDLPDTLLERADQALLNAKHRARASRRPTR